MSESSNPIPEEPPEPLYFSIDLQPVEDLVPEHDPSPGIIAVDLLNAEDILPRIPEAVPTPSLISGRLSLEIPQSTLHAGGRDVLDTSQIEVFDSPGAYCRHLIVLRFQTSRAPEIPSVAGSEAVNEHDKRFSAMVSRITELERQLRDIQHSYISWSHLSILPVFHTSDLDV